MLNAIKNSIISLEQALSSHFYHPHWAHIRKSWTNTTNSTKYSTKLARMLILLVSCVKAAVFNPVWNESLGHVR